MLKDEEHVLPISTSGLVPSLSNYGSTIHSGDFAQPWSSHLGCSHLHSLRLDFSGSLQSPISQTPHLWYWRRQREMEADVFEIRTKALSRGIQKGQRLPWALSITYVLITWQFKNQAWIMPTSDGTGTPWCTSQCFKYSLSCISGRKTVVVPGQLLSELSKLPEIVLSFPTAINKVGYPLLHTHVRC